ncbi:transposase [Paenibacillus larvae]|uniref:transposase n=1 Tax=Paenibacillus larvae TaxID=1464 RepID=UPI0039908D12
MGIDLGLLHLAVISDSTMFKAPKQLRRNESHLKQLQRAITRKKRGSKRTSQIA